MTRIAAILLATASCWAEEGAQPSKKADLSQMPADVHAPLFRSPKSQQAGNVTDRLLADKPAAGAAGKIAHRNFIDKHIFGKMERDRVRHAPLATDEEFFRRVTLDLTGRIPTPADRQEFLDDNSPDKRSKLIDKLVGSPAFVDKWAYFLMDTFRANGKMMRGVSLFHNMLKDSLAADRPYNDLAASIMAASGKSNYVVAAANPIVREHVEGKPGEANGPDDLSKIHQMDTHDELGILFAKVFLGINISCIACHDGQAHLEKVNVYLAGKRRSDFFRFAAFMGNTRYIPHVEGKEAKMGHFTVDDNAPGYDTKGESMLRVKRFGGPNDPKFILTDEKPKPGLAPREELGRLLTEHPQFA
ncbi:MAG: DUF1549 domain-containing protein, partial [Bryobacterales bacterium]|nr:DUF1549 domain-containing protein [Bryobacterales bacterium]